MNNRDQENGAPRGPLIFTVPAYGFVMALYLDWLNGTNRAAFSAKTFAEQVESVEPARYKPLKQCSQLFYQTTQETLR
jgi:hypothetical protein